MFAKERASKWQSWIARPQIVMAAGNKPKQIGEYVGRLNSGSEALSIARMVSPSGWSEPGQTPDFDEYTLVLRGFLRVHTQAAVIDVNAGQAVVAHKGEWVSYSTPGPDGAEYVAVCLPAFSIDLVHRDDVEKPRSRYGRLTVISQSIINFMKQQGFTEEESLIRNAHFVALNFQPRIIGMLGFWESFFSQLSRKEWLQHSCWSSVLAFC